MWLVIATFLTPDDHRTNPSIPSATSQLSAGVRGPLSMGLAHTISGCDQVQPCHTLYVLFTTTIYHYAYRYISYCVCVLECQLLWRHEMEAFGSIWIQQCRPKATRITEKGSFGSVSLCSYHIFTWCTTLCEPALITFSARNVCVFRSRLITFNRVRSISTTVSSSTGESRITSNSSPVTSFWCCKQYNEDDYAETYNLACETQESTWQTAWDM